MPPSYAVEERNVALLQAAGTPRRVLDVGCGIGQNGAVLRGRGATVIGLESSEERAQLAAARLDRVLVADLEDAESVRRALAGMTFDCLLLGDVLEHTREPARVLETVIESLEPEGRVVISLPNVAAFPVRIGLLRGRFEYVDSGVLDRTHLRFFTKRSAIELGEQLGLELLFCDHNPMGIRSLAPWIRQAASRGAFGSLEPGDPLALTRSPAYVAYQTLLRPLEHQLTRLSPELLAFQHVLVFRKRPVPRKLSVVVGLLTMNEEASVGPMIAAIRENLPDAQILVVDSSSDRTPQIARDLGVDVIRQHPPRGHGPAMEVLMNSAAKRAEALLYLDCDFTYPPHHLRELLRLLEQECIDVVNCARTRKRPQTMPWANYLANRTFAGMARLASGVRTVDVHSGMRAYRSSVIRAFQFDGEGDALPIDTLLWPALAGFSVLEVGIEYDERVGQSKLRKVSGGLWSLRRIAKLVFRQGAAKRFVVRN